MVAIESFLAQVIAQANANNVSGKSFDYALRINLPDGWFEAVKIPEDVMIKMVGYWAAKSPLNIKVYALYPN